MKKKLDTPKKRPGRPRKDVHIHTPRRSFRISDEDYAIIQAAAESAGMTISDWVRETLLKAAAKRAAK